MCLGRTVYVRIADKARPTPGSLALNRDAQGVFALVIQIQIFHVVDKDHDLPNNFHDWNAENCREMKRGWRKDLVTGKFCGCCTKPW